MSSRKKKKVQKNSKDSVVLSIKTSPSDYINDTLEDIQADLENVFIPKSLHEHFECVVGKHVSIEKPWTKISIEKITEDLNNSKSCFSKLKTKLLAIQNKYVLVGYKSFGDTDEEFLICTTDRARQFIEKTKTQLDRELEQKVKRSMALMPGQWKSKNSEKDIEEIKPIHAREKITYKWKLPTKRLQAKTEFEDSKAESMKNNYVKLEPRLKEVFEISDMLTIDSSVQAIEETIDREMQTIPRIKDNKCIQVVAVKEEMFQSQNLTESNKDLNDFLEKHVPNLVTQLHYNELYDLYRNDYMLLKNDSEIPTGKNAKVIKLLDGYQNVVSKKKYVSCHAWHPTILGIFAVSYTSDSNAMNKPVSLQRSIEEITKSTVKNEKPITDVSYDDENKQESWDDPPENLLGNENYREKIMCWLNEEFVQKMRMIQLNEDEQINEQYNQDINRQLRSSFNYVTHVETYAYEDDPIANSDLDNETLIDENSILNEAQYNSDNIDSTKNSVKHNELKKQYSTEEDDLRMDSVDHHDSDTESFYNIWGDDEEWLYGNKLRNSVRNLHREFNNKYDREAREDKLLNFLKSEANYIYKKNKVDEMEKERTKLTKDLFEAGDVHAKLKGQRKFKNKKSHNSTSMQNKPHVLQQNNDESLIKRENTIINEHGNSVIIWSVGDHIFPMLKLESPEEVCCVEFNPRNGDTVVGGLKNGQICIWDIKGKLEAIGSNKSDTTNRGKEHHRHLEMQMKWSLDVHFETKIRPAALSAIIESHDSIVTGIQWIHPMNKITSLGKLIDVQEGQFSDQFFTSSLDGNIKLWDLQSKSVSKYKKTNKAIPRFEHPEILKNYKSPLSVYHNRLKPSYTIRITEPGSTVYNPITAFSFEIPLMQYKCTSDQPLEIGKRQFEFIPTTSNEPNNILVVGSIWGQIGVVTWNGYDIHQQDYDKEECKHIWWGHVHDGPINCIRRNPFHPEIILVSGGNIASIWSMNYKGGPIWWKRFEYFTNSVLWSSVHPAEFRVSFNINGILQFWNLMKFTHKPYHVAEIFLGDGLVAKLSAPYPPIHFIGKENFKFNGGINDVMDYEKNELISFSDSTGTVILATTDPVMPEPNDIENIVNMFRKEVDRRNQMDAWNDEYKEVFGSIGENNIDEHDPTADRISPVSFEVKSVEPILTPGQIKRKICDEIYQWYLNRSGPQTRLDKMKQKYMEREKRYMVEMMLKKKKIDKKKLKNCHEIKTDIKPEKYDPEYLSKIRSEADETFEDIVNQLLSAKIRKAKEYVFEDDSMRTIQSDEMKIQYNRIHQLLVIDNVVEKEKMLEYIEDNPYIAEQKKRLFPQVIELAVTKMFNDPNHLKTPALRMLRRNLTKEYVDGGGEMNSRMNRRAAKKGKIDWWMMEDEADYEEYMYENYFERGDDGISSNT